MDSHWSSGYVSDVVYTHGYYPELNPARIPLALYHAGFSKHKIATACELGFGQGLSTNIHAAASNVEWWGTDFNPSQAAYASNLSSISGANIFDNSFEEFLNRADLPKFDFIALHGIWSWISDENRKHIITFIKNNLRLGGIVYVSYNTLPGWSTASPLRQLMIEYMSFLTSDEKNTSQNVTYSLDGIEELFDLNPSWLQANPTVKQRFSQIKTNNKSYLAHEYFNRDWHPMYFAQIAKIMSNAKLIYSASANLLDSIDAINLTKDQTAYIERFSNPDFKQTLRDFCVNQQFRKDYWIKGAIKIAGLDRIERLRSQNIVLICHRDSVPKKVRGSLGDADLNQDIYEPIADILADNQIKSIGELEIILARKAITFVQILQAIIILIGAGIVAAGQDKNIINGATKKTKELNRHFLKLARSSGDISYLASPITGGGILVDRFQQLFLLAISEGKKMPPEWAKYAADILSMQGQSIIKDGKPLTTLEENLEELHNRAQTFNNQHLSVLKALQII